jgi:hypothetical protein
MTQITEIGLWTLIPTPNCNGDNKAPVASDTFETIILAMKRYQTESIAIGLSDVGSLGFGTYIKNDSTTITKHC